MVRAVRDVVEIEQGRGWHAKRVGGLPWSLISLEYWPAATTIACIRYYFSTLLLKSEHNVTTLTMGIQTKNVLVLKLCIWVSSKQNSQTIRPFWEFIFKSFTTGRKRHIDLEVDSSCLFKSELKNTDSIFILRAFILSLYVGLQMMKYEAC